jgi:hypothetical protein
MVGCRATRPFPWLLGLGRVRITVGESMKIPLTSTRAAVLAVLALASLHKPAEDMAGGKPAVVRMVAPFGFEPPPPNPIRRRTPRRC